MNILARTIFHTHVDDQSHAEVTQVVVIFFRGCGANEQVIGDGGEVHVGNGITGIKSQIRCESKKTLSFLNLFVCYSLLSFRHLTSH